MRSILLWLIGIPIPIIILLAIIFSSLSGKNDNAGFHAGVFVCRAFIGSLSLMRQFCCRSAPHFEGTQDM